MSVIETANNSVLQRLGNHGGVKKYFFNTSWMMVENIFRLAMGLIVGFWVARYLGPEQFGVFSYVLAFVSIFSCFAHLGLDGILVREIIREPESSSVLLGTAFWLKIMGALFSILVIAISMPFLNHEEDARKYIYIVASGMLFQSFVVIDAFFQSQVLSKFVSVCKLIQLAISSILKVVLVLNHAELFWFFLVLLLDSIMLAISLSVSFYLYRGSFFCSYFDINLAKRLLSDSWPLIFSSLAVMIYMRIDQVMIKHMLSDSDLGLYSAAVRLSEVWYFIPTLFCNSLFPAILNARKESEAKFLERLNGLYFLLGWMAIFAALLITFTGKFLIVLFYGEKFALSGQILMINIWSGLFVSWGAASGKWYLTENLTGLFTVNTIAGGICNVLLNLYFIPLLGLSGAALATVISYFIAACLMNLVHKKTRSNFVRMVCSLNVFKIRSFYEAIFKEQTLFEKRF